MKGGYLTAAVASAVTDLKQATVDDITRYFPGFERQQLSRAMRYAHELGLIKLARIGYGGRWRLCPLYCALSVRIDEAPAGRFARRAVLQRRVSSVWDYAQKAAA